LRGTEKNLGKRRKRGGKSNPKGKRPVLLEGEVTESLQFGKKKKGADLSPGGKHPASGPKTKKSYRKT